jgi:hypothetical protein
MGMAMSITLEDMERFGKLFAGWTTQQINIAWQMILFLRKARVSIEEFEQYAEFVQSIQVRQKKASIKYFYLKDKFFRENSLDCPDCGEKMVLEAVNHSNCARVPGGWKSVWTCSNLRECGKQVWNKKTIFFYTRRIERKFKQKYKNWTPEDFLKVDIPKQHYKMYPGTSHNADKKCGG